MVVFWLVTAAFAAVALPLIAPHVGPARTGGFNSGVLPGQYFSQALRTNGDGSVVVGNSADISNTLSHGLKLTSSDGMVDLGFLPGGNSAWVVGLSTDVTIVVVFGTDAIGQYYASYWTSATC